MALATFAAAVAMMTFLAIGLYKTINGIVNLGFTPEYVFYMFMYTATILGLIYQKKK